MVTGEAPAVAPVESFEGSVVKPDASLNRPAAILAEPAAVAGLDNNMGGSINHLLDFVQQHDGVIGKTVFSSQPLHFSFNIWPVAGDGLCQKAVIEGLPGLRGNVIPFFIFGKVVK